MFFINNSNFTIDVFGSQNKDLFLEPNTSI